MTMLIAGHETTAATLTWTLFELAKGDPGMFGEVQAEVRMVLKGKTRPDLRLYPEPPVLIHRARATDNLPVVGLVVGFAVGLTVGLYVGLPVGPVVGFAVGLDVGLPV